MSDLITQFEEAAANAQNLKKKPDNDTLLKLYSLYKQGSKGDVAGSRPGFTNPVGRAKFDAWAKLKGTSKNDAMQSYIDLIGSLQ
jgi:diazepam-binding inhibitor (GABA receptor modulating acyl-CoA-binding protein)